MLDTKLTPMRTMKPNTKENEEGGHHDRRDDALAPLADGFLEGQEFIVEQICLHKGGYQGGTQGENSGANDKA